MSVYICVYVCLSVFLFLNQMMDIHKLRCGHYDVREDAVMDLRSVHSVRTTWQSQNKLKK